MKVNNPNNMTVTPLYNGGSIHDAPQTVRGYFSNLPNVKEFYDLTYLGDTQGFTGVKCMFIDNSENDGALFIHVTETGQRIKCPAGRQGYFPVLTPSRAKLEAWHDGTKKAVVPIYFLNFEIANGVW